jgi:PAS domain S-box-containing protein
MSPDGENGNASGGAFGLPEEADLYLKALEFSSSGVVIADREGRILYVNRATCLSSGYEEDELIGALPSIFKSGAHSKDYYKKMWATLLAGQPYRGILVNKRKDGSRYSVELTINPIFDSFAKISHFIAIQNDVTEKQKILAELTEALTQAQEASKMKTNLLGRLSHELRTPLNGITGMVQLLQSSDSDSEREELQKILLECSDDMLEVIENLLDVGELHRRSIRIEASLFNVKEMFDNCRPVWAMRASKKNLAFEVDLEEGVPLDFFGDRQRIEKVLHILVGNACKFSTKGTVRIHFNHEDAQEADRLRFEVFDEGPGISPDFEPTMFDTFSQEEEDIQRSHDGLGLGLPLAKGLVEMMGGSIGYGRTDKGMTCFWFEICLTRAQVKGDALNGYVLVEPKLSSGNLDILIAEDDVQNQKVLKRMLESMGHHTVIAPDGLAALAALEQHPFDIIFMDCRMPTVDGFETAIEIRRRFKESGKSRYSIPIIAVTADVLSDCRAQCNEAGMNHFITKPFSFEALEGALARFVATEGSKA